MSAKLNPVQKYLWNALEDWRVENALAKIFPGCKGNFQRLIEEHFGNHTHSTQERAGQNPALSILNYVLLTVRAWDVTSIEKQRAEEAQIIKTNYPHLLDKMNTMLNRAKKHCQSTQSCIDFALELYAVVERYVQDLLKDKREKGESSEENVQQLQDLLQENTSSLPKHMGESLASALEEQTKQQERIQGHSVAVAVEGNKVCAPLTADVREEIARSSVALRTRLHGLLQASVQQPCVVGRKGRLHPPRLHNLWAHDTRVFLKSGRKRQVSTAVHLLLDCSGSMDSSRMQLASQACYGMALALEQCRGVNVGVTAFPATTYRGQINHAIYPIIKHGQKVHHSFGIKASGCTPLTEALWWVMQQMYSLKEERKIICILSDGMPDSVQSAKHALNHAQKLGFEVLALGIKDNSLEMLLPHSHRTIHDLNMLPAAMFEMLQQSLLQQ